MKKLFVLLLCAAIPVFGFVACNGEVNYEIDDPVIDEPDGPETPTGPQNETISVTLADGQDLFAWTASDYVAYYNGTTYVKSAAATPAGGGKTAKFKVNYTGTRSSYAYYPFYLVQDPYTDVNGTSMLSALNSSLTTVILPDSYSLSQVSGAAPCPMIADNSGESWEFKQLCGLLKLTVNGLPAGTNQLVITFDKDVTGSFAVSNPDSATPSIATTGKTSKNVVTVSLPADASLGGLVLNIPVPTGSVNVSSVEAKMDGAVLATLSSVVSGWTVARAAGKDAPAAFTPSMARLILAPGNLYTDNGKLAIAANCYDHIFYTESVNDYNIADAALYSMANRTHFNCNELYFIMNSSGLTTLPTMEVSSTNYVNDGTYETLVKSDFGDGKAWKVPSAASWGSLFSADQRPGAKLSITIGSEAPVEISNCAFVRVNVADIEGELGNGADGGFCGFILFPDNVAISTTFIALTIDNINLIKDGEKETAFTRNQITKENLDALIAAGCAFLPATGMVNNVAFANNNLAANYLSSTSVPESETQDYRLRAQRNTVEWEVKTNKVGPFSSVRLARELD